MDELKLQQIADALEGLTYSEWSRVRMAVEKKYSPDMGKVQLADTEGLVRLMKLEF